MVKTVARTLGPCVLERDALGRLGIRDNVDRGEGSLEELGELVGLEVLHAAVGVVDHEPFLRAEAWAESE